MFRPVLRKHKNIIQNKTKKSKNTVVDFSTKKDIKESGGEYEEIKISKLKKQKIILIGILIVGLIGVSLLYFFKNNKKTKKQEIIRVFNLMKKSTCFLCFIDLLFFLLYGISLFLLLLS